MRWRLPPCPANTPTSIWAPGRTSVGWVRWPKFGGPDQVSGPDTRAGHSETMGVLSARDPDLYEAAVAALLDHLRATEVGLRRGARYRRSGGLAVARCHQRPVVCVRIHRQRCPRVLPRRPLVRSRPRLGRRRGRNPGTGPDAELPTVGDTSPKTATFTWRGFRGLPIPITQTLPPVPQTYLTHRGEVALAVAAPRRSRSTGAGRWPTSTGPRSTNSPTTCWRLAPHRTSSSCPRACRSPTSASWPPSASSWPPTAMPRATTPSTATTCWPPPRPSPRRP